MAKPASQVTKLRRLVDAEVCRITEEMCRRLQRPYIKKARISVFGHHLIILYQLGSQLERFNWKNMREVTVPFRNTALRMLRSRRCPLRNEEFVEAFLAILNE